MPIRTTHSDLEASLDVKNILIVFSFYVHAILYSGCTLLLVTVTPHIPNIEHSILSTENQNLRVDVPGYHDS